jgi:Tol biopolymer transport system component
MEIGARLAHYRIDAKLGEGGMGEVYRAEDTKLRREVAIKVLPPALADDPERLARMEREAQVLAALNHPNIAAIYGLEEATFQDAVPIRFLVMELAQGHSLAARLGERRLDIDESLKIALQIAEALEAAHDKGIVHRDLKPANVHLATEGAGAGQVKVLDFGLAKAYDTDGSREMSPELSASPTMAAATRTGMIMGTAAFMSPEQARGKQIDKRTDIWAFGCVLYEMLTGRRAFGGETITDILAAIVHQEPAWDALPVETPQRIRDLLRRCLQKSPENRLRDIGEARIAIEAYLADPEGEKARARAGGAAGASGLRPWQWAAAAAVLFAVAAAAWMVGRSGATTGAAGISRRFDLGVSLDTDFGDLRARISPDGRKIVYPRDGMLWLQELSALEGRPLPGTEDSILAFWSPDSREIAFGTRDEVVWRLPIDGGEASRVTDVREYEGGVWPSGERMVIGADPDVAEVAARGGDPRVIVPREEGESDLHVEAALPDGRGILFRPHSGGHFPLVLWDGQARRMLVDPPVGSNIADAAYAPSGHLLYTRTGGDNVGIWARPFSLDTLAFTGDAVLLVPGGGNVSVAADGTLLYIDRYTGAVAGNDSRLTWATRDGSQDGTLGQPQTLSRPRLAPDQGRVAVVTREDDGRAVWIHDARGSRSRVSASDVASGLVKLAWLAATNEVVYEQQDASSGGESRIVATPADRVGETRFLADGSDPDVSTDGRWLIFAHRADGGDATGPGNTDIWYLDLADDDAEPMPFLQTDAVESMPVLSPDGRLLAYESRESGQPEIHVRPFPEGAGRAVVSLDGGREPVWSTDGRELFYIDRDFEMMAVSVEDTATLAFGSPTLLFDATLFRFRGGYDVARDGRFLMVAPTGDEGGGAPRLVVWENWVRELEQGGR